MDTPASKEAHPPGTAYNQTGYRRLTPSSTLSVSADSPRAADYSPVTVETPLTDRLPAGALSAARDAQALRVMHANGVPDTDIIRWALLGPLSIASRLDNANFPLEVAEAFPRDPRLLSNLADSLSTVRNKGMRMEHLAKWHAAGVFILKRPWVDATLWATWRATAIRATGFEAAAVGAAAGLSPTEVRDLVEAGTWDNETVEMMAALRASR